MNFAQNLPPGSLLVITAEVDQGTSDIDGALTWRELF